MKHYTNVQFFLVVCFLYFALGCTNINLPDSTPEVDNRMSPTTTFIVPVTSEPDPLTGTRWKLVAFESEESTPSIPEQPQFFVEFWNGELSLRGGCNSVGGHYVLQNAQITITLAKRTEVDCSHSGSNVNEIELFFSNLMPTFDSYALDEDEYLRIRYIDGVILLRRMSQ